MTLEEVISVFDTKVCPGLCLSADTQGMFIIPSNHTKSDGFVATRQEYYKYLFEIAEQRGTLKEKFPLNNYFHKIFCEQDPFSSRMSIVLKFNHLGVEKDPAIKKFCNRFDRTSFSLGYVPKHNYKLNNLLPDIFNTGKVLKLFTEEFPRGVKYLKCEVAMPFAPLYFEEDFSIIDTSDLLNEVPLQSETVFSIPDIELEL